MAKCCSSNEEDQCCDCTVKVNVDVPKIVRYLCVAGVLIVGIIFGTRTFQKMMDGGFFDIEE